MSESVYDVRYGVNFSELLSNALLRRNISKTDFAKGIGRQATAISNRLKKPFYGSIYDLLDASIITKTDLISPALKVLESHGIQVDANYSMKEYEIIKRDLELVKEDNIRYKKTIDKLL